MNEDNIIIIIANALDLIHKEILMKNAYDVGLINKDHYQNYLKTMLYVSERKDNHSE